MAADIIDAHERVGKLDAPERGNAVAQSRRRRQREAPRQPHFALAEHGQRGPGEKDVVLEAAGEQGPYLLVGHSESLTFLSHEYRYVRPAVYQKLKGHAKNLKWPARAVQEVAS